MKGKKPFYKLIYILRLIKLETLKICIKTHLKIGFIQSSNSSTDTLILFDKKPDKNLWLYIDYQGLNNLIIKKQYLVLLIDKLLDALS